MSVTGYSDGILHPLSGPRSRPTATHFRVRSFSQSDSVFKTVGPNGVRFLCFHALVPYAVSSQPTAARKWVQFRSPPFRNVTRHSLKQFRAPSGYGAKKGMWRHTLRSFAQWIYDLPVSRTHDGHFPLWSRTYLRFYAVILLPHQQRILHFFCTQTGSVGNLKACDNSDVWSNVAAR